MMTHYHHHQKRAQQQQPQQQQETNTTPLPRTEAGAYAELVANDPLLWWSQRRARVVALLQQYPKLAKRPTFPPFSAAGNTVSEYYPLCLLILSMSHARVNHGQKVSDQDMLHMVRKVYALYPQVLHVPLEEEESGRAITALYFALQCRAPVSVMEFMVLHNPAAITKLPSNHHHHQQQGDKATTTTATTPMDYIFKALAAATAATSSQREKENHGQACGGLVEYYISVFKCLLHIKPDILAESSSDQHQHHQQHHNDHPQEDLIQTAFLHLDDPKILERIVKLCFHVTKKKRQLRLDQQTRKLTLEKTRVLSTLLLPHLVTLEILRPKGWNSDSLACLLDQLALHRNRTILDLTLSIPLESFTAATATTTTATTINTCKNSLTLLFEDNTTLQSISLDFYHPTTTLRQRRRRHPRQVEHTLVIPPPEYDTVAPVAWDSILTGLAVNHTLVILNVTGLSLRTPCQAPPGFVTCLDWICHKSQPQQPIIIIHESTPCLKKRMMWRPSPDTIDHRAICQIFEFNHNRSLKQLALEGAFEGRLEQHHLATVLQETNNAALEDVGIPFRTLSSSSGDDHLNYQLKLNRFGRAIARSTDTTKGTFVQLLCNVSLAPWWSQITAHEKFNIQFGLLQEEPGLWSSY